MNLNKSSRDIINVSDVELIEPGSKRVLISNGRFSIGEGEFVILSGLNGCGKTLLIKSLVGIETLQEKPKKLLGFNITHPQNAFSGTVKINAPEIGCAFQDKLADEVDGNPKVMEYLENFLDGMGLLNDSGRSRLTQLLDIFSIQYLVDKELTERTENEISRINALKAFIHSPTLVFLSGLDKIVHGLHQEKVLTFFREEKSRGTTIVFELAGSCATYINIMDKMLLFKDRKIQSISMPDLPPLEAIDYFTGLQISVKAT